MESKRNQPCPCGSGKRYKKCCGLSRNTVVSSEVGGAQEKQNGTYLAENLFQIGLLDGQHGRLKEAEASFRRAIAIKPRFTEAHYNLGVMLEAQGLAHEAMASYLQALKHNPDYIFALINLGCIFINQGKMDEADAAFRRALNLQPDNALLNYSMGFLLKEQGKMEEAILWVRKALTLQPDYAEAYKHLSTLIKFSEVDDDIHAMEKLYNKKGVPEKDLIHLGFALGKAYRDLGDYGKSFSHINEANRWKRKSFEYSIQEDIDLFERIKKIFSHDFFSSHIGSGIQETTPIFIVGMPRSGTTLVEQILASSPLVFGAGELPILKILSINCSTLRKTSAQFPECMLDLDMDDLERTGLDYIKEIREFSADAQYIIDKLPHNFLRIGLIKTILPNAKVIHCLRNPMANCFSIFKTDFTGTHRYSYDMTELGQYYKLYLDLMDHWEKVLPGFLFTIRYEELVSDQENQIKNLLDLCGLPWDEACLAFHETERKISTASCVQVRQPIYNDSVKLWQRYERQLEPLRKAIYG